ncbi:PAAR domain-containing protein [Leisingera sp. ANG-Vp]|uniref:PAAR domain-containing protein n=1 Tax=Leisingera sp. ANG-Vp TaxID=1577896 RepID=UPI0009E48213
MPGVSRIGQDTAGGTIDEALAPSVRINGSAVAVLGCAVAPHGIGVHAGPIMATASDTVFAQGTAVCRQGDLASCGHAASGSANVRAGG